MTKSVEYGPVHIAIRSVTIGVFDIRNTYLAYTGQGMEMSWGALYLVKRKTLLPLATDKLLDQINSRAYCCVIAKGDAVCWQPFIFTRSVTV